ncbi:CU044_5270 family protein [Streptosporangium canum]|uniref:CU044_5270 family protein n=1 Tax=Streptosporangium canum TaxID=324952 RepID=UPI0033A06D0F
MNEFELIDDVMPDVPSADPGKAAEARARVLNGGRRRRVSAWTGVLVASAATVAVIGAIAVVPRLGGGPVATVTQTSAEEVLSAAADRMARRQEATGGRYWRREMEQVYRQRISVGGREFVAEDRVRDVRWNGIDRNQVMVFSGLGTRPFTAADRAEWEKAGSPRLCGSDTDCRNDMIPVGKTRYLFTGKKGLEQSTLELSVRELLDLPHDPAELKEKLLSYWPAEREAMKKSMQSGSAGPSELPKQDYWLWGLGERLLLDAPTTPGTRAAVYRMLAGLHGVRVADGIRDVEGRVGVAILRGGANGEGEEQIVIDRETGDLLATQDVLPVPTADQGNIPPGIVYMSMVIKKLGWTDDEPVIPEGCGPDQKEECLR